LKTLPLEMRPARLVEAVSLRFPLPRAEADRVKTPQEIRTVIAGRAVARAPQSIPPQSLDDANLLSQFKVICPVQPLPQK
jgi:hypothetical protein